ncbi:hypothetical protein REPUB_Repub02eG0070400 [Reevesia pubescens]
MENGESSSSCRPSIGFPLGLAILLILLFCISGVLICYLNWHKIRDLILQSSDQDHDDNDDIRSDTDHSPAVQAESPVMKPKQKIIGQSLPVWMPGDQVPRFIAMACPCEPATIEKIKITVQKPPALPNATWKRDVIDANFSSEVAAEINAIPCLMNFPDVLTWQFENVKYYVRSAYKFLQKLHADIESSVEPNGAEDDQDRLLWKKLWQANVPNKITVLYGN